MKMNSFEKFCDKLVSGETYDKKEVFDERQKIVRLNLGCNAAIVFGCGSALNNLFMDEVYQWCESYTMPMVIVLLISLAYYYIACKRADALFGVKGVSGAITLAFSAIFMGTLLALAGLAELEGGGFELVRDGMLTDKFMGVIIFGLYAVFGIALLIVSRRRKPSEDGDSGDED